MRLFSPRISFRLLTGALVAATFVATPFLSGASSESGEVTSLPFQPLSGPRGATLFKTLSPSQTGIVAINHYDDPKMWAELFPEFTIGPIGTGIAIGDFDGDGKPDVFVVCKTGENHLYRNLGNFKFEDVTAKAGVGGPTDAWKQGATFVDVNNDGLLDLYVCRFGAPNLLYINQGDGTFKEEAAKRGLAVSDACDQAAFMDYDRDGKLDVFIQTNLLDAEARPTGQRNYLFHNNGDGTFTNVTDEAHISTVDAQGHSATWWDYNEDGWPDLYVANDFKEPDILYRNNGDGTFTNVLSWVVPHTPHSSMGADLADINNDGHIDLLVADMATTTRLKDQRTMARMRAGLPESDSNPGAAQQYMRNALFVNTGTSHMLEAAIFSGLAATDWTWSVRLEDLDNDGLVDAFFTNGTVREFHNADLGRQMMAVESIAERNRMMRNSPVLAEKNLAFHNRGDLAFDNVSAEWGLDQVGAKFGAAFGDLDGDGDLDLIYANYDGTFTVCRNDSDTGHRVIFDLRGHASNSFGIGAIVKIETSAGIQVRPMVLARGYLSQSEPMVHFGLGKVDTIRRVTVQWPSGIVQTLENVAADRRYTLHEPDIAPPTLTPPAEHDAIPAGLFVDVTAEKGLQFDAKEASFDELKAQPLLTIRLNRQGPAALVADLDGDGEEDILVGGTRGTSGRIFSSFGGGFLASGEGSFSDTSEINDAGIVAFDANGDGTDDLFVTKGGDAKPANDVGYQPRLLLNDGHGHFTAQANAVPLLPISAGPVAVADFNRDGQLDVFIGGRVVPGEFPTTPTSALLENQNGKFVDVTDTIAPALRHVGMVTGAIWSDIDGDGWLDLIVTLNWGGVKFFHNENGKRFVDESAAFGFEATGTGWWNSIASADFNGDGRPDFVIGNVGLNTVFHASSDRPAVLYAGDLDGSGRSHLLDAQYEGDRLYPMRSLEQMMQNFPSVGRKYTKFEAYGKATVTDVFSASRLDAARKLTATEFRSGVFLSQPDGHYRFQPLPAYAQLSPIFGLVVADFDGDGHLDICAVQNSFAPIPEIGRFDGGLGLLLRGDGKGNFTAVPARESAFVVAGDAKALVTLDLDGDGWPDLFVTRNNFPTLALRNRGIPGHQAFSVILRGPRGNPHAIGARVTVTLTDGSTQTSEVEAGAGYLSQSSPSLFFGYPEKTPPQSITVRWPNGQTTTQPWQTRLPKIVLNAPAK
jgi:hypothetical protein